MIFMDFAVTLHDDFHFLFALFFFLSFSPSQWSFFVGGKRSWNPQALDLGFDQVNPTQWNTPRKYLLRVMKNFLLGGVDVIGSDRIDRRHPQNFNTSYTVSVCDCEVFLGIGSVFPCFSACFDFSSLTIKCQFCRLHRIEFMQGLIAHR